VPVLLLVHLIGVC